mmetsp:Transcript_66843/g.178696  ORF Transcript_66843/g.178696 Transcript_66843/m.178696 type:complete len:214 (+) Transcript_66843:277-918(+)
MMLGREPGRKRVEEGEGGVEGPSAAPSLDHAGGSDEQPGGGTSVEPLSLRDGVWRRGSRRRRGTRGGVGGRPGGLASAAWRGLPHRRRRGRPRLRPRGLGSPPRFLGRSHSVVGSAPRSLARHGLSGGQRPRLRVDWLRRRHAPALLTKPAGVTRSGLARRHHHRARRVPPSSGADARMVRGDPAAPRGARHRLRAEVAERSRAALEHDERGL